MQIISIVGTGAFCTYNGLLAARMLESFSGMPCLYLSRLVHSNVINEIEGLILQDFQGHIVTDHSPENAYWLNHVQKLGRTAVITKSPVFDMYPNPSFSLKELRTGKIVVTECSGKITNPRVSCLLYTSPSPRDGLLSRMPSSA